MLQGIDVCINNAGLALPEPLLSGKTSGWRTMMDVSHRINMYFHSDSMQLNTDFSQLFQTFQLNVIALSVYSLSSFILNLKSF